MNARKIFFSKKHRLRALWRILIFSGALILGLSPLLLVNNSYIQFLGAVSILIFGLVLNSKYLDKLGFSDYGLILKKETFVQIVIGIIIGFISVIMILYIGVSTDILLVTKVESTIKIATLLFATKMLLVSIFEETFYRGYLFTTIYDGFKSRRRSNKLAVISALIMSSTAFGIAHFANSHASFISILFLSINGVIWCIPFIITKNLGLSIGLHTAWNFTQTQIGFTMSGNQAVNSFYKIENNGSILLTGGEYGPEAGVLGLLGFIIMLRLSLAYLNLKHRMST